VLRNFKPGYGNWVCVRSIPDNARETSHKERPNLGRKWGIEENLAETGQIYRHISAEPVGNIGDRRDGKAPLKSLDTSRREVFMDKPIILGGRTTNCPNFSLQLNESALKVFGRDRPRLDARNEDRDWIDVDADGLTGADQSFDE